MTGPDPIKPKNEIVHGGVRFDTNDTKGYGTKTNATLSTTFWIDLVNGTRVVYSRQNPKAPSTIWETGKEPTIDVEKINELGFTEEFENIDGLTIYTHDKNNTTRVKNCQNVGISGSNGNDDIVVYDSRNIIIDAGSGHDYVHISNSENFCIDTGDGKDNVSVTEHNNESVDTRNMPLPNGIVELGENAVLGINLESKGVSYIGDDSYTDDTMTSKAVIKGGGTHNILQTPRNAFETTLRTSTYDENGNNISIETRTLESDSEA